MKTQYQNMTIKIAFTLGCIALASFLTVADSALKNKDDINDEIKKFQQKLEAFEKPSPEVIKSIIKTAEQECKTNRTFDEEKAKNMTSCVENLFNQTAIQIEFQNAIPKGELDDAFRKICLKWPEVKNCMSEALDIVEECFEKGKLVNKGLDGMVEFFCGAKNDGALIALFLAEGGLNCLEQQGDTVKDCINENTTEEHQEDLCKATDTVIQCAVHFKKCSDPTPENLISSMIRQVQRVMNCPVSKEALTQSQSQSSSSTSTQTIFIINAVLLLAPILPAIFLLS